MMFKLQVLGADLGILDEIDSGLDVDALRDVAKAVNGLLTPRNSVLMITHYLRLLEFIKPTFIHIMVSGLTLAITLIQHEALVDHSSHTKDHKNLKSNLEDLNPQLLYILLVNRRLLMGQDKMKWRKARNFFAQFTFRS